MRTERQAEGGWTGVTGSGGATQDHRQQKMVVGKEVEVEEE